jgi:hypothetical protein
VLSRPRVQGRDAARPLRTAHRSLRTWTRACLCLRSWGRAVPTLKPTASPMTVAAHTQSAALHIRRHTTRSSACGALLAGLPGPLRSGSRRQHSRGAGSPAGGKDEHTRHMRSARACRCAGGKSSAPASSARHGRSSSCGADVRLCTLRLPHRTQIAGLGLLQVSKSVLHEKFLRSKNLGLEER